MLDRSAINLPVISTTALSVYLSVYLSLSLSPSLSRFFSLFSKTGRRRINEIQKEEKQRFAYGDVPVTRTNKASDIDRNSIYERLVKVQKERASSYSALLSRIQLQYPAYLYTCIDVFLYYAMRWNARNYLCEYASVVRSKVNISRMLLFFLSRLPTYREIEFSRWEGNEGSLDTEMTRLTTMLLFYLTSLLLDYVFSWNFLRYVHCRLISEPLGNIMKSIKRRRRYKRYFLNSPRDLPLFARHQLVINRLMENGFVSEANIDDTVLV